MIHLHPPQSVYQSMQNAFVSTVTVEEEDCETESGGEDGDLLGKTLVGVSYTDADDEVPMVLPSDGYSIFDGRPSLSESSVRMLSLATCNPIFWTTNAFIQATYECAPGYMSFSPLRDTRLSRFRQSLTVAGKHIGRNWSNILLIFVPIGIFAPRLGVGDSAVFVLNSLAIIALADVLCRATDDVASYLGETAGALLNITMGNATELVILYVFLHFYRQIIN